MQEVLLTTEQVANYLKIDKFTVYRLVAQKRLPAFKVGNQWHHHEAEDELFLVVKGRFLVKLRDRDIWLEEGEFVIVPRGVEHKPIAEEEALVLLLEPKSTLNTGNVRDEKTVADVERI